MAVISDNTFDPLRGYTGVRLQQGVPIADADWNELEDARKFELRSFLRWFVGDGLPAANDGFRIAATQPPGDDDFRILSGIGAATPDGLTTAGRCLAGGLEAIITADLDFKAQTLHQDQPGADEVAAGLGVSVIARLSAPTADEEVIAYLDVWERLVTPTDDPTLVLSALGTETCARMKRGWVVRVRHAGTDPPALPGHGYLDLGRIRRHSGIAVVAPGDITDVRPAGMTVAVLLDRLRAIEELLVLPAFAPSPDQFTPTVGIRAQEVVLRGRNFDLGNVEVQFGLTPAEVLSTSRTQITTRVPDFVPDGVTRITVRTDGGEATSDDEFTVLAGGPPAFDPPPNEFAPQAGRPGVVVTLHGRNFDAGGLRVTFHLPIGDRPGQVVLQEPTRIGVRAPGIPLNEQFEAQIEVETEFGATTTIEAFTIIGRIIGPNL
jgi:Family of unknown function (DUF6519)/IPT/TIG domain